MLARQCGFGSDIWGRRLLGQICNAWLPRGYHGEGALFCSPSSPCRPQGLAIHHRTPGHHVRHDLPGPIVRDTVRSKCSVKSIRLMQCRPHLPGAATGPLPRSCGHQVGARLLPWDRQIVGPTCGSIWGSDGFFGLPRYSWMRHWFPVLLLTSDSTSSAHCDVTISFPLSRRGSSRPNCASNGKPRSSPENPANAKGMNGTAALPACMGNIHMLPMGRIHT